MIRRTLAALSCLAAVTGLAGCSAAAPGPTPPPPSPTAVASIPADGVLLSALGFTHAPADFSVPATSTLSERVDQENTVVAVFTAPGGLAIASYLRGTLAAQGWVITADGNNSLLFERGDARGAFTVTGALAALSIRYDKQS